MSYAYQSPPQKADFKASSQSANLKAMQTTSAGTRGFEPRETINSVNSGLSQPLKYSASHFSESKRDNQLQMSSKRNPGSQYNNRQSMVSPQRNQSSHSGEDVRDRIISMYKEEIRVQAARDRDFEHLTNLIADLERRSRVLEVSIKDSLSQNEDNLQQQKRQIQQHQQDIESIKRNVHERQQEGIGLYDDIQQTKAHVAQREDEIYSTSKDLDLQRQFSEQLKREIDYVKQDIFAQQDVKQKQQGVIFQLKNEVRFKEKENEDAAVKLNNLEREAKVLQDKSYQLNQQLDSKSLSIDKLNQNQDQVNREIAILQSTINALDMDIVESERQNDRALEYQKKLLRTKEQEQLRGQDLTYSLKENEQKMRDAEKQIDYLKKDLESVRYSNDAMLDRNQELKEELASLNQHADLLQSQNRELQRELDSFVETDEVVRRNLDRKDKVYQIRSKVDEVIQKSMYDLNQKSPSRRRSPEKSIYKPEQSYRQEPPRQTYFNESMNARGSPLRRGQLDH